MAQDANKSTFRQWLTDYGGIMLRIARSFASRPEDQDELFQEIALRLWSSVPSFRGEAQASTWVYRVSLNTALTWQRTERRRRRRHGPLLAPDEMEAPQGDGSEKAVRQGMLGRICQQVRLRPPVDRALMVLHLDGMSYREIAGVLGLSESNAGAKLSRIRKRLAEAVKGEHDG